MTDIELILTNDLIEELKKRYEDIVIVSSRPEKIGEEQQELMYDYKGDWLKCLGLLDYAKRHILELNRAECEEDD